MRLFQGFWYGISFFVFLGQAAAQQGVTYHTNQHAYWYFLTPTGYGPPPKKNVLENGMIAATQYQKTTRNGHTTTLGLIPTILLAADFMPIWITAHGRFPMGGTKRRPTTIANIGGFFLSLPKGSGGANDSDFSLFYANFTFGSRDKNFAIGGAIAPTGFEEGIRPFAFTLHGLTRLGRRSCLVTENYIINDRGTWIPWSMSGWRFWWRRTALDVGILLTRIPAESSVSQKRLWLPIPWLAVHKNLRFGLFNQNDE